jgi:hypothetical protein
MTEIVEKELQNKNECQQYQEKVSNLKKGIEITHAVWNKYKSEIKNLIQTNKIKSSDVETIQRRIELLDNHWRTFKKAWEVEWPGPTLRDKGFFDPKRIPNRTQNQILNCFSEKLTELHDLVQNYAYPGYLNKLYQLIETLLLELYNCLLANPEKISDEQVSKTVLAAAYSGQTVIMSSYRPIKYNYPSLHKILSGNTALLKEDLNELERGSSIMKTFKTLSE